MSKNNDFDRSNEELRKDIEELQNSVEDEWLTPINEDKRPADLKDEEYTKWHRYWNNNDFEQPDIEVNDEELVIDEELDISGAPDWTITNQEEKEKNENVAIDPEMELEV